METVSREILNVEQAAEFLGFSPYTVREKARLGEIPGRKVGREWRFSREALLEWIREGERSPHRGYVVVVTPDPDGNGYVATIQGVPDVRGRGKTEEEAVQDVRAALEAASYAEKYRTELLSGWRLSGA
jgi:excisionase family DNA binding protein